MTRTICLMTVLLLVAGSAYGAQPKPKPKPMKPSGPEVVDPAMAKADPDFSVQGEYLVESAIPGGTHDRIGVQVIARGEGKFEIFILAGGLPGDGWKRGDARTRATGQREGEVTIIEGDGLSGEITAGKLALTRGNAEKRTELSRIERQSPTLGKKPPEGAVVLFDGSGTDNFIEATMSEDGNLIAGTLTKREFNSFSLHLEFRLSWKPWATGQARSNSGGIRPHQSSGIYQAYMRGQIGQRANVMQVGDTCVWVLNYNAATGAYELWNSKDNNPLTGTRAPVDFSTGNPVTLGTTTAANRFFIGLIGEVMIFDAPLSQAELDQYKSDLVYKWVTPLEEKVMAAVPNPADGLSEVPRDGVGLSWTPGILSTRSDIYLGRDFEAVSAATADNDPAGVYMGRQSVSSLALPRLEFGQTYYWRVDAVDGQIYTGPVWSFTTERFSYPLAAQYITAQASSTYENSAPENTINGSGLNAQGLHSTDLGAMWLSDVNDANQAWIQYDFPKPYKLDQMLVWNHNSLVEPLMGWGIKEAEIEYTPDGIEWMSLGIVPFNQAPGMDGYAYNTSTLFDLAVQGVRVRALSNFGGIVRIHMFGLSEVRFLTVPVEAADPNPSDGATAIAVDTTLNWTAGREALSHELYLSDDLQAVLDETVVPLLLTETGYEVTGLHLGTTYYWKIDEVNEAELAPVWQGNVWSFSTVASIVVDDMESYKDIEGRWIWETWADGFGDPANGATVGHGDLPETQVVHGGTQSLPLSFDNSSSPMSEATRTFDPTQDWARSGIQNLILYVQFSQESTGGEFYVKINGVKIAAVPVAVVQGWSPITVDLAGAGTDLSKVATLTIGVDGAGAKGVVYVDDIMLMN